MDALEQAVARLLRRREGHFVYESGHHGALWLELERLFLDPRAVRPLSTELAARLAAHGPEVVCGPLVEGAFAALQVAEELGLPFTYATPRERGDARGLFPVAYPVPAALHEALRGRRVAVVNDVVNAGSAVGGTLAALEALGARPVALGTLATLGGGAAALARERGVALEVLAPLEGAAYAPDDCPLCARGLPLEAAEG